MNALQVGPLIIKTTMLFTIIAVFLSWVVMKKVTKTSPDFQKQLLDSLVNSLLIGLIIYKASIGLFRPELLKSNILAVLYLPGGTREAIIGFLCAGIYIAYKWLKYKWHVKPAVHTLIYGVITFFLTYWTARTIFYLITGLS